MILLNLLSLIVSYLDLLRLDSLIKYRKDTSKEGSLDSFSFIRSDTRSF